MDNHTFNDPNFDELCRDFAVNCVSFDTPEVVSRVAITPIDRYISTNLDYSINSASVGTPMVDTPAVQSIQQTSRALDFSNNPFEHSSNPFDEFPSTMETTVESMVGIIKDLYRKPIHQLPQDMSSVAETSMTANTSIFEPPFMGLSPSEIQLRRMSPLEQDFRNLKGVEGPMVLKWLRSFIIYNGDDGMYTLYSKLNKEEGVADVIAWEIGSTLLAMKSMTSMELYNIMYEYYSRGIGTPNDVFYAATSNLNITVPLTGNKVSNYMKEWLIIIGKHQNFKEVSNADKVRQFLASLPTVISATLLRKYGKPPTVELGLDSLKKLSIAFQEGSAIVADLTVAVSPSKLNPYYSKTRKEVGTYTAAQAVAGYVPNQKFQPVWFSCWHCGVKHTKEEPCPNTADKTTHCGPCGNVSSHTFKQCKMWDPLQAHEDNPRNRKVHFTANAVSSSSKSMVDTTTVSSPSDVVHIDSGSNALFLTSASHSDTLVIPITGNLEVEAANGSRSSVVGLGTVLGREAVVAPSFTDNLIGVSPFCKATDTAPANVAIFDQDKMIGVAVTPEIQALLDLIENIAVKHNLIKLTAQNENGLYTTSMASLKHLYAGDSLFANASYYKTVKTNDLSELVQFAHEQWGHANEQQMVWIVEYQTFKSIPKELTVKAIHKYFPMCGSCIKGNLNAKPIPSCPLDRDLKIGEEVEIDIKYWKQKSFSGGNMSLTAIDSHSKYIKGWWLKGKKKILDKIKEYRADCISRGHELKVIRVDNEFHTTEIKAWCQLDTVNITLLPCIPYKHNTTLHVERSHQSIENRVVTALDLPHLSDNYVAYAYFDVVDKLNFMPSLLRPDTTPHNVWFQGDKIDLQETPMFPFGAAMKIHIPTDLQTTESGRSVDGVYVGIATSHRWGVQIYNTLTGKVVIRSDFKVIGPEPYISTLLRVPVLWEWVDEEVSDHPSVYGADMGFSESIASSASESVEDISKRQTDPFQPMDSGIDANRDLTTGESVLFSPSESITDTNLHPSVDNQPINTSLLTDEITGSMPDDLPSVSDVSPEPVPAKYIKPVPTDLFTIDQEVTVVKICGHTGIATKTSKLYFNVEWGNGAVTWKKYSAIKDCIALDDYIELHPELEILNKPLPEVSPDIPVRHRYETRHQLQKRLQARLEAFKTGVYCFSETPAGGMVYNTLPPEDLPVPSVSCALPGAQSYIPGAPSSTTRKRGAKYGTQGVVKMTRASIPKLSRRALLAAQQLDEETRPSRKALVAAQIVEDEATYDPLLIRNIEAGQYSEDLLTKGMELLTELDTRASGAGIPLVAALGNIPLSPSVAPLPPIPLSVSQALDSVEWESWMKVTSVELESLKKMSVWHTPLIPFYDIPKQKIIPSKIIFARKYNADGTFQKYKARLCARGDRWQEALGVETYAGTVKSESIKLLLGIAAEENFEICCVDVETAFLHSPLPSDQTIYMRRPVGLTDLDMPEIVELDKCLYGLPQASNRFREHSDGVLRQLGFKPTISDPCVYVMYKDGGVVYALIHVDDIGLIGTTVQLLTQVKVGLSATYTLKETDMSNYLGMHIVRDRLGRSIKLLQTGYIDSLILKYGPELREYPSSPSTPMLTVTGSPAPFSSLLGKKDITEYQGMVGSLMYLASQTRPDILYAVCAHARFSKTPTMDNREGVIRILQYVNNTRDLGLKLFSGEGIVLYATVDASYACHTDLKSHTGCTLHLGRTSGSIFSLSKKQTVTADSSTVAELIAAHLAAHEIMWARNFLSELGYPQNNPTTLFEDNMSTISLIVNKGNGQRSKHIDLRYNFVREQVVEKVLAMIHLPGVDMTSDILTKPLGPTAFLHLRPKLLGMAAVMSNNQIKKLMRDCKYAYQHMQS
jgi:hypothetical protein